MIMNHDHAKPLKDLHVIKFIGNRISVCKITFATGFVGECTTRATGMSHGMSAYKGICPKSESFAPGVRSFANRGGSTSMFVAGSGIKDRTSFRWDRTPPTPTIFETEVVGALGFNQMPNAARSASSPLRSPPLAKELKE